MLFTKTESPIQVKSFDFALRIIKLYKHLQTEHKEFVLSKQILKSGTSIGANIKEAQQAESKADFIHKLSISLKEANETEYWLELLHKSNFISDEAYKSIHRDLEEILKLLTAIIKTSKKNK